MKVFLLIVFISIFGPLASQSCEEYNRTLFHILPKNFPEIINCVDAGGNKQGPWIHYKISFSDHDIANVIDSGFYVAYYSYGYYKDDLMIDDWYTINNVYPAQNERIDNYYYGIDTNIKRTHYINSSWKETVVYYNADSSIINSKTIHSYNNDTVYIRCNSNSMNTNCCQMIYKNELMKGFPIRDFEKEFYGIMCCFMETVLRKKREEAGN